jgi:hypothetical protein
VTQEDEKKCPISNGRIFPTAPSSSTFSTKNAEKEKYLERKVD